MATIPEVCLSPGSRSTPVIGMGTAAYPFLDRETMKAAGLHAIELGYGHFDTAAQYYSEQFLGEAIAEALRLGLIKSRSEVFVTSKLWCTSAYPDLVLTAFCKTLQPLQMEFINLYLIHFPVSLKPGAPVQFDKEDILPLILSPHWKAMEECHKLGLEKLNGVSNFSCKKLSELLATATIPPAVNQICLRWAHERGVSMLVKSFTKERLKENLQIFDWELTEEESHKISLIPQIKSLLAQYFVSEKGAYKSIEEFWDGEV